MNDMKEKSYYIAEKLVDIYSQMENKKRTLEQQKIIEDMNICSYNDDGRRNGKIDYFYKRINNINEVFILSEDVIYKNPDIIMPRPVFDISNYNEDSLTNFLKVFIENDMKDNNRKNKYNLYKNINVDKDNSYIIDIINKISDKKYKLFEYIESNYYLYNLEKLWQDIRNNVKKQLKEKFKNIPNKKKINQDKIILYKEILEKYFHNIISDFKDGNYYKYIKFSDDNRILYIIKYKIIWNWFIKIVNTIFQYIVVVFNTNNENNIIDELNILIENNKKINKYEENIADGYYKYYYMLETSLMLNMELITLNYINKKEYIFLKKEDLFVDEENNIKEEFLNIDTIKKNRLNQLFNSGSNCPKDETFIKNMEYCKKFICIYNDIGNRQIPEKSIKSLRAVYRALFVNNVTYKRLNTYNISKKVIDFYEESKKNSINNVCNPDYIEKRFNNIWNNAHENDTNFKEHNFILGNCISNEILLEEFYGYNTIKFKSRFMQVFNKLSLLIFYRDCPGMNAKHEDVINALNNIEYNFDKIMAVLMKCINNTNRVGGR